MMVSLRRLMSAPAVLCISVILAAAIGYAVGKTPANSGSDDALPMDVTDQLTVHETLAVPFLYGTRHIWYYRKRANPEAKSALYHIVEIKELERYHRSALLTIGYIGDATDARKMQGILSGFSGVLTTWEKDATTGILYGLGIMSRRGIVEATEILDEMTSLEYWRQADIKWFSDEQIPHRQLTPELEILARVFRGHALAERDNLDEIRTKILEGIEEPRSRKYMAQRIGQERTSEYVATIRAAERTAPTEKERKKLQTLLRSFAEHFEGLVDIEPETAEPTSQQPAEAEWSVQDIRQVHELIREGDASVLEILRRWLDESPEGPAARDDRLLDDRLLLATYGAGAFRDRTVLDRVRELYENKAVTPLIRNVAAEAIARMASHEELELLEEIMWNQQLTVSPRCEAAAALVRLDDREAAREFLLLQYDLYRLEARTRSVRNLGFARSILAAMSDEKLLAALEARLLEEADERMKRNIITLREQMSINAKPVEALMVLAANPDWEERSRRNRAIEALGRKGSLELIPFLEQLVPWEGTDVPAMRDKLLKRNIEEAIGKIRQRH